MIDHQDMIGLISAAAEYQRKNPRHAVRVPEWSDGIKLAWLPGEAIRAQDRLIERKQRGQIRHVDVIKEFGKALKTANEHFGVDFQLSEDVGCR